jgi:NADH:ubiquinone oxidoreductase subunit E
MQGGGRIRDALVDVLGTDVGGVTLDGSVRFVAAECGGDNGGEPLVTLDGQKQPGMNADRARAMAQNLRASSARTATA